MVRELDLALYADGSVEYEYSAVVDPGDRVVLDDVVSGGEYTVEIVLDSQPSRYRSIEMNGCDEQIVYLGLRSDGDFVLRTSECS